MGYGYIPENRRAKDVRVDNYDKKFPEGVTNVEDALDHLNKELNNIANELGVDEKDNFVELQTVAKTIIGAINELKNSKNSSGTDAREIELQKSTDYIQWRYVGDTNWTNLIALSDLEGEKGEQGIQGIQGATGEKGDKGDTGNTGVGIQSVVQTTTSTEDGGSNVITVTKTDNSTSTFTVKNGSKGEKGDKGDKGDAGAKGSDANVTSTNVINALGYTPANQNDMNNIANELKLIGSGNTIKLMLGTKELSSLTISNGTVEPTPTTYSITNTLSNCTNSNTATTIEENTSYSANISTNEGYRLKDITVTMGE